MFLKNFDQENKLMIKNKAYVREIRKFYVAVVQRRLRNVQKKRDHVQSCCFAYLNDLLFFCRSRCRRHCCCLSSLLL